MIDGQSVIPSVLKIKMFRSMFDVQVVLGEHDTQSTTETSIRSTNLTEKIT